MEDQPTVPATRKPKIDTRDMILMVQNEADTARIWARACSPGTAYGLNHRADVLEAAATVVANAEVAIEFCRANANTFRKWREGK